MSRKITIGIIEDEPIVMESLTVLFSKQLDITLHSTGLSVEAFLKNQDIEDIDVLLLDIQLPGMSGLQGMRLLRDAMPKTDIVMLTTVEDEDVIFKALCAGASGYISKRTSLTKILEAVRFVNEGGSWWSHL